MQTKNPEQSNRSGFGIGALAEGVGFEPTIRYNRIPDFESGAFDLSATLPRQRRIRILQHGFEKSKSRRKKSSSCFSGVATEDKSSENNPAAAFGDTNQTRGEARMLRPLSLRCRLIGGYAATRLA